MFARKKIGGTSDTKNIPRRARQAMMIVIILGCIAGVGFAGQYLIIKTQATLGYLSENTIDIVSDTFGKPMVTDSYGNVNILLVGIGGENHDGGLLADAIIIAAWNPELKSVSMISIPRDLYVDIPEQGVRGRINQVFSTAYYNNGKDLNIAAKMLAAEVGEITGIKPEYYAVVDFNGFKYIIDAIGGIEIDVPERIYDTTYPNDANRGYITFHLERGLQYMDGTTALRYARSRHSSSDFARSQRQQQIIQATIKQILRKENIQNIATIKKLYDEYTKMVTTNISNQEVIGMLKHIFSLEHMFNFGLTSVCSTRSWHVMTPGCFLYTPPREWFGGASILVTNGSTFSDLSFYDYTKNFAHIVAQNQDFLIEGARIKVLNGVDKVYAQSQKKSADGHAGQIATKLKKYGFTIVGAESAEIPSELTTVTIYGDQEYQSTIQLLQKFFSIGEILRSEIPTKIIENELGEQQELIEDMGFDIVITLGNQYLDERPGQFNFNM